MARYDRYDRWREPRAFSGWYPGAFWAGAPMYGWDGMAGWPPYLGADPFGMHPDARAPRSPYDRPFQGRDPGYDRGYAPRYDRGYDRQVFAPRRAQLGPRERMRYDRDHYDPRGARRYDERYERVWDRWW